MNRVRIEILSHMWDERIKELLAKVSKVKKDRQHKKAQLTGIPESLKEECLQ
jgi:hypothetical protein